MSLPRAIEELEGLVEAGNSAKPPYRPGSTEWYLLRVQAMGLSFLRSVEQRGLDGDYGAVERLYRRCLQEAKTAPVPPEPVVIREKAPAD